MTSTYSHLLAPGRIGSLSLRNRILMCPMGDAQATGNGYVTDQQIAYYEERARGGAALLLVGSVGVTSPDGLASPKQAAIANEDMLDGWKRMAERVHAHGARLALQLVHNGKVAVMDIVAGRPMWVPSIPVAKPPDALMGMLSDEEIAQMGTPGQVQGGEVAYRVMTREDIAEMASLFADAAERARRAGIDAIELHAGHGYLIDTFLSPTSNFRTDEYGGSVENRARFLCDVLEAIRDRVGPDFPVWCRMNGEEFLIDGETLEDACRVAELAESAGADALHVSTYADPSRAIGYTEAHSTHTPGRFLEHAAAIKKRVGVPIIAVGRLDPERAERALAEGTADFVAMGRKLLADPDLPNKLGAGQRNDIRPCIYHYRCISQAFLQKSVACATNARTGRELDIDPESQQTQNPERILVVGAGPSGMEAARLAALRGHDVVLAEAGAELGGRFTLAAQTAEPNAELLAWFQAQVTRLPIDVRLGTRVSADFLQEQSFDRVFVATGADWCRPNVPGADRASVKPVDALADWLMAEDSDTPGQIVVLGGDKPGLALAGVARDRGANVTVLEPTSVFALSNGIVGRWRYVHEARERGIALEGETRLVSIETDHVHWIDGEGQEKQTAADWILAAGDAKPDRRLADALAATGTPVSTLGDCRSFGGIAGGMEDALRAIEALA